MFEIIHTVSRAWLNNKSCEIRKYENDTSKFWTYITTPEIPFPIKTGSWYRMGTVNWRPPHTKVCDTPWLLVFVAIFIAAISKAKISKRMLT